MPHGYKRSIYKKRSTYRRAYAKQARHLYGSATHGFPRMAMRRMQGPPAALYPRVPTNATALKCVDELSTGNIQSTTSPAVLVVPLLGSAFFNRLSNRTRGVSLQLTGFFFPTGSNAAALGIQYARVIIYYDRQANGANPSQATILTDTTANGTAAAVTPMSGINMNNRDRFMILRDRKVLLPELGINGAAVGPNTLMTAMNDLGKGGIAYQEFIKLKGLETLYNSTNGGTIGDISAGAFGILIFNSDASGSPGWSFDLQARFKFLD